VSSTKSMTGHLLGAAGGIEAIVTVLAIPGHPPPTINTDARPGVRPRLRAERGAEGPGRARLDRRAAPRDPAPSGAGGLSRAARGGSAPEGNRLHPSGGLAAPPRGGGRSRPRRWPRSRRGSGFRGSPSSCSRP
jgi:hypothetical protein